MRKSKQKAVELEQEEQRQSRKNGLSMVALRDRGWGKLRDLKGNEVVMVWGVKNELARDNKFKLIINSRELILDAEEVRRFLRWA